MTVKKGVKEKVGLTLIADATDLLKNDNAKKEYTYDIKIDSLEAPLNKGEKVGTVKIIDQEGTLIKEADVTVTENIKKAGFLDYFKKNFKELLIGKNI